jgi:hypothetical protein
VIKLSDLRSIGYTWEWGQSRAAFYMVANTLQAAKEAVVTANRYRQPQLNAADALELMRWSAGYFPYPAGLSGPRPTSN